MSGREPLSPAKRKRLQKLFEHASKQMSQESHDYATELFAECVLGDPSNLTYVQSYIENLQKKYNNNKTGSKLAQFKERGARSAVKKAVSQSEWDEVIKHGLKVLTVNPWDVPTLTAMATAAGKTGEDECELYYLKCALGANLKDPDVNRQCAMALGLRGQFDQAIVCWHRVEQARPGDEEAARSIAHLAVQKARTKGGYDEFDRSRKAVAGGPDQQTEMELSPEERLRRRIAAEPDELVNYLELAQFYISDERYLDAEEVFAQAYEVSDGDADVRERWEDVQLRHLRQQIALAEKQGDKEARSKFRKELIRRELEVYENRCRRYPNNLGFKYELGYRYQLAGQYNEAIKELQVARNDPRRKGLCMLRLGQCFQQIKQNRLAMSHYDLAIQEIPDRDAANKKDALYRAGKMAMDAGDIDTSEKHLATLAGLDFTYKDVSVLLDKIAKIRRKES